MKRKAKKMIKGINKNVVVIKDIKNEVFEEAIFILRPQKKKPKKSVLLKEVRKIIESETDICLAEERRGKMKKR